MTSTHPPDLIRQKLIDATIIPQASDDDKFRKNNSPKGTFQTRNISAPDAPWFQDLSAFGLYSKYLALDTKFLRGDVYVKAAQTNRPDK
jgi:hypothetical protein